MDFSSVVSFLNSIDRVVFLFLNRAFRHPALDGFFFFVSLFGCRELIFLAGLAVLFFAKNRRIKALGLFLMAGMSFSYYVVHFLKHLFLRPRPFMELKGCFTSLKSSGWSFPSGHSAAAFLTAVLLSHFFRKSSFLFYITAFFVALSRVYGGVHYPGDVIVGGVIGSFLGWILVFSYRKIFEEPAKGAG